MLFGGVCVEGEKIILWSYFKNNSVVLKKENNNYSVNTYEDRYFFYHWVDDKTLVKMKHPNQIEIIYNNTSYKYDMSIDKETLEEYLIKEYCSENEKRNFMTKESDGVNLSLLLRSLKGEK